MASPLATSAQARPAQTGPATPAPAAATAPPAAPAPLPRDLGGIALGRGVFAILADCQRLRYRATVVGDERTVTRRGVRYTLSALRVVPPPQSSLAWVRLSFLDGRLLGLRASYRTPSPTLFADAQRRFGPLTWENGDRAEWLDKSRRTAYSVTKAGDRAEIADLGHARDRGFLTADEIDELLDKRRGAKRPPSR